jgi:hypothetical protein
MKRLFAILILSGLFASCIQYQEKMKLNSDGSGEITISVGISESIFNMGGQNDQIKDFNEGKIKENFSDKKGIKLISSRTYSQDGNRWVEVKVGFQSIKLLMESNKDSSQHEMIGDISLSEDVKGNMVFTRKISKADSSSSKDSSSSAIGSGMMELMFGQYKWKYELTVPGNIISTNAESNDVDYKTNTVKWSLSMASLSHPQIMTVTFEKTGQANLTLILLGGLAIIVLAFVFYRSITKKNKMELKK